MTLLFDAYAEDVVEDEARVVLRFAPRIAPIKAAFLPLMKKQSEALWPIYEKFKQAGYQVQFDEAGSIGKRYRRQDEIGTPVCFTYDFESEQDHCVTARNRDTTQQERVSIDHLERYLADLLKK